jgi:hypothetical protein
VDAPRRITTTSLHNCEPSRGQGPQPGMSSIFVSLLIPVVCVIEATHLFASLATVDN